MDDWFAHWGALSEAVRAEMAAWRRTHPRATLTAIETALDAALHRLRAQMLADLAQTSPLADLPTAPPDLRPPCPACQQPLQARGRKTRHLQTTGGADLALTRAYATGPACRAGLFPPG
jgi:hypothetical protein